MGLDTLPAEILQQVLGLVFPRNWLESPHIRTKLTLKLVCKYVDQNIRRDVFGKLDIDLIATVLASDMNDEMVTRLLVEIVKVAGKNENALVSFIRDAVQCTLRLTGDGSHDGNKLGD